CNPRLNPSSSGRSTRAVPSSTRIVMLACIGCVSEPRGPLTVTTLSWPTATSTPLGSSMGCLPILLIVPSPHVGEHFAADALARRVAVRHHALRRAHDRDPEPTHHPRQLGPATVRAPAGLGDPAQPRDRPLLPRPVLQAD